MPGPGGSNGALADVGGTVVAVGGGVVRVLEGDGWSAPAEVPRGGTGGTVVVGTDDEVVLPTSGAAYEPASGTWRDVPVGAGAASAALWTGDEVVVLRDGSGASGLIYDPVAGERREVAPPSGTVVAAAAVPGGVVAWTDDEAAAHGVLSRLDTDTGRWAQIPAPPFEPSVGGIGLAAEGQDRLVATVFSGGETQAAVLDLPDGTEWTPIDPPPTPSNRACPIDLHRGEAATVFEARCSGDLAVLDGGGWRSLPPVPIDAAAGEVLVTDAEALVLTGDGSALARMSLP